MPRATQTTWHTDPYRGGSTELGLGGRMDVSSMAPRRSADDAHQGPQLNLSLTLQN